MNYEEFKEALKDDIKNAFEDMGMKVDVSEHMVDKFNHNYDAITVRPEGQNIGVTIDAGRYFSLYEDGKDYSEVAKIAIATTDRGLAEQPDVDIASLTDYSQIKDKLTVEVVSSEANAQMLEKVPHREMEDLSIVYRMMLENNPSGIASIVINNDMLENMGVTPEQLHEDAMKNSPEIKPVRITSIAEMLMELNQMTPDQLEMMGMSAAPEDQFMFVATVPNGTFGAGVIAYENFMEMASQAAGGGDIFVLPSSRHEVIIVPDNGTVTANDLVDMVKAVNSTEVQPEDKLTDSVYHYDSKDKIFELSEKFEKRMAEKEMASEHGDKESVLDDLKTKQKETCHQAKKDPVNKSKGEASL